MLDIRLPIGGMFLFIGALLGVYGMLRPHGPLPVALPLDLNTLWGAAMAGFGLLMLGWMRARPTSAEPPSPDA
ncbi:MAG: hypothetical protein VKP62_11555 [Candidatus Sericytochromatia bacterium]|nr:hypothetical protein [Candidatus Sericytochromatia bacterium]